MLFSLSWFLSHGALFLCLLVDLIDCMLVIINGKIIFRCDSNLELSEFPLDLYWILPATLGYVHKHKSTTLWSEIPWKFQLIPILHELLARTSRLPFFVPLRVQAFRVLASCGEGLWLDLGWFGFVFSPPHFIRWSNHRLKFCEFNKCPQRNNYLTGLPLC